MNQQKHRPALHDEVLYSHGPDLRTETNGTRDGEKEDGLPIVGLFVTGPEKVRLRPDKTAWFLMDASAMKLPSIVRCVGLKSSSTDQHALSDLGNVTRDFMWKTPVTWG